MQFFYIDYMNNGKKERNIGFLRVENDGVGSGECLHSAESVVSYMLSICRMKRYKWEKFQSIRDMV